MADTRQERAMGTGPSVSLLEQRLGELERYVGELERIRDHRDWRVRELQRHAANLESELATRVARVDELETHTRNLMRRLASGREPLSEDAILPRLRHPRLARLAEIGNSLWLERPDLRRLFGRENAADFWSWLLWHGPELDSRLAEAALPLPDSALRDRVVGDQMSAEDYRRSGLVNGLVLEACLRDGGFRFPEGARLLDFGAGCGRVLTFFSLYAERCQLSACDVDGEAVAWCQSQLDFADAVQLPEQPPAPFPSQHFDAAYAYSVFSHLPARRARSWLEELHRILRPGATLVLTTHGRHAARRMLADRSRSFPPRSELERRLPELATSGFVFFPYRRLSFRDPRNQARFASWDLDQYGDTFIDEAFVRREWDDLFDLVLWREAPDDWQDHVVLRRRTGGREAAPG